MLQRQLSGLVDQCIDIETEVAEVAGISDAHRSTKSSVSPSAGDNSRRVNVLMVGTGEYTTGYGGSSAQSDKAAGGRL